MTSKQKQQRKQIIKERAASAVSKKVSKPAPSDDYAEAKIDAYRIENEGKWAEAEIAWGLVIDCAKTAKEKKSAAGRKAAAKVRASAAAKSIEKQMEAQVAADLTESAGTPIGDGAGMMASTASPEGERAYHEEQVAARASPPEEMAADAATMEQEAKPTTKSRIHKALKPTPALRAHDPRLPATGTVIIKRDRLGAERCRCTVVEAGVKYAGTTYKTISAAAMAAAKDLGLASKSQDGYAFWGLKKNAVPPQGSKARAEAEAAYADAVARFDHIARVTGRSDFPAADSITAAVVEKFDLIITELRAIAAGLGAAKKICK